MDEIERRSSITEIVRYRSARIGLDQISQAQAMAPPANRNREATKKGFSRISPELVIHWVKEKLIAPKIMTVAANPIFLPARTWSTEAMKMEMTPKAKATRPWGEKKRYNSCDSARNE